MRDRRPISILLPCQKGISSPCSAPQFPVSKLPQWRISLRLPDPSIRPGTNRVFPEMNSVQQAIALGSTLPMAKYMLCFHLDRDTTRVMFPRRATRADPVIAQG